MSTVVAGMSHRLTVREYERMIAAVILPGLSLPVDAILAEGGGEPLPAAAAATLPYRGG